MIGATLQSAMSRVRTFPPTRDDFDPGTAPPRLLRMHGLPQRPDPRTHPHQARLWSRVFAQPLRFVEAEVGTGGAELAPGPRPFGTTRWGGVYHTIGGPGYTEPATWIAAEWVVPIVYDVGPDAEQYSVGFWIGIDGIDNSQVIQAGVQAVLTPSVLFGTDVDWSARAQWWTAGSDNPSVTVRNFPVKPGDTVTFTVCAAEPNLAYIAMANVTQGIGTSIAIPSPDGTTSAGRSVQWMVEVPDDTRNGPAGLDFLPGFAPVVFDACMAGSGEEVFQLAPGGVIREMSTDAGRRFTRTAIQTPDIALIAMEQPA